MFKSNLIKSLRWCWYTLLSVATLFYMQRFLIVSFEYILTSLIFQAQYYILPKVFGIKNKSFVNKSNAYKFILGVLVASIPFLIFGYLNDKNIYLDMGFFMLLVSVDLLLTHFELTWKVNESSIA